MTILTVSQVITAELAIWAVPKSKWVMEDDPSQFPFNYEVFAGDRKPYADGSVKVETTTHRMMITAGIDLLFQAVDTLEQAKKDAYEDYLRIAKTLDDKLSTLRLLSHAPDPDAIEGEVVEAATADVGDGPDGEA